MLTNIFSGNFQFQAPFNVSSSRFLRCRIAHFIRLPDTDPLAVSFDWAFVNDRLVSYCLGAFFD